MFHPAGAVGLPTMEGKNLEVVSAASALALVIAMLQLVVDAVLAGGAAAHTYHIRIPHWAMTSNPTDICASAVTPFLASHDHLHRQRNQRTRHHRYHCQNRKGSKTKRGSDAWRGPACERLVGPLTVPVRCEQ